MDYERLTTPFWRFLWNCVSGSARRLYKGTGRFLDQYGEWWPARAKSEDSLICLTVVGVLSIDRRTMRRPKARLSPADKLSGRAVPQPSMESPHKPQSTRQVQGVCGR